MPTPDKRPHGQKTTGQKTTKNANPGQKTTGQKTTGQKATKLVFLWRNLKSPDVFFYSRAGEKMTKK